MTLRTTLLGLLLAAPLAAQDSQRFIRVANGSNDELAVRDRLEALLERHDVEAWTFTRTIMIEEGVIPHSHPVLTIDTDYPADDRLLMSTFLHEQFHWFVDDHEDEEQQSMAAFAEIFPNAPGREGQGARNQLSTYLHLIVCDLELQAMTALYGEEIAREVLAGITHYQWIYERVLNDPRVREVNTRFGFVVPMRSSER